MQVKQVIPTGNFLVTIEADVTAEQQATLANFGLRWLAQRNSNVDKILGGFDVGADGKAKRKESWTRNDAEYSAELAEKLAESYGTLKAKDGEKEFTLDTLVDVSENTREGSAPKLAKERTLYVKRGGEGKLSLVAEKVGYEGPIGDGTADGAPLEFLRAIKAWTDAQAAMLGA
jgi:hypothetical protein